MDINEATESLQRLFLSVVDKHLPWNTINVRKNSAAWVNPEFLSFIDRWAYISKLYTECPCEAHLEMKKMQFVNVIA